MAERRVALIIASNRYEDEKLQQLIAPAQDAKALVRVLEDTSIGDFRVQMLLDEPSHKIRWEIEAFFRNRERSDLLLLYFSCHGIKDDRGRLYYATVDTRCELLRSTAVPSTFVNDVMYDSRSRRQVLILDCCYSGAFAKGLVAKTDKGISTKERFEGRGRVVLTASDAMQYAFAGDKVVGEGVQSVFTHHLVRGLETGEADLDGDGLVSLDELYDYVYRRVTDETPQRPGKWALDVQGEIIVARNPNPEAKVRLIRFSSGEEASSVDDWIVLVERNWDEASEFLYSGLVEKWLAHINRLDLAREARRIRHEVTDDRSIGLEQFQRLVGSFKPQRRTDVVTNLSELIGQLTFWKLRRQKAPQKLTLELTNQGRGYLHGKVISKVAWISVPQPRFGCLHGQTARVDIVVNPARRRTLEFALTPLDFSLE
jgi:hypothetical protein